jgi:hypothetical protein
MRPLAIVGNEQQAGGIQIKPTNGMQFVQQRLIHQHKHCIVIRILGRADITGWFMHDKIPQTYHLQFFFLQPNFIGQTDLGGRLLAKLLIHLHQPLSDQFASLTAG